MSPEQAQGEAIDERSDIFSLGSTFFHIFSSRLPFEKPNVPALLAQIANEDAPLLTDQAPHLPRPLALVVRRMMSRTREDRYQDVGVVLEDLSSYERRGLLRFSDVGSFVPIPPLSLAEGEPTKAHPLPSDDPGDVVI
jgi:serine/threonine-protein kinase